PLADIYATTSLGRAVEILVRVALQLAFVAAIFELVRIRVATSKAVNGLRSDATQAAIKSAALLGSRILPRLERAVELSLDDSDAEPENPKGRALFAKNAAKAMGEIVDPRALSSLKLIFQKDYLGAWKRLDALRSIHKIVVRVGEGRPGAGPLARF